MKLAEAAARGQSGVGRWMIGVAVVGLNLGGALALPRDRNWTLLAGVAPTALALQFAASRLARGRGRWRAFWAGFVAAGSVALASFAYAMIAVPDEGQLIIRGVRYPGPPWATYDDAAFEWLLPRIKSWFDPWAELSRSAAWTTIDVVVYALPQLLIALGGGSLALLIRQAWGRSDDPSMSEHGEAKDPLKDPARCN